MPPKAKPKGVQPREMSVILEEGQAIHRVNMAAKWKAMEYIESLADLGHNEYQRDLAIEKAKAELIKIR